MPKKYTPMAIAYDFDGTLAAGNMQEHQFLPDIGMTPDDFWREVKSLASANQADEVLMYMYLMLKRATSAGVPVRKDDFRDKGRAIQLFDGVQDWFDRITDFAKTKNVRVAHYLISSGNAEIFDGTAIAAKFEKVYASKFLFNENGVASWPALAVNYTTKTQYLFRINKGAHDISDNAAVNRYVPKQDRPIPFENIIFIGDGSTDIPCFRLVKEQGGLSVAVFPPKTKGARERAASYLQDGRVHGIAAADYQADGALDRIIKAQIELVSARSNLYTAFTSTG